MSLPLVVLAAGLSTRYGRLKQLEPLGPSGEAIMDYNVFDAARSGFGSVVFVVREELLDDVRDHVTRALGDFLPFSFVIQELRHIPADFRAPPDRKKPWGTAHAVLCAAEAVAAPFGVCNADDLYGPEAFGLLHESLSRDPMPWDAALVGYPLRETLSGSGGVARAVCHLGREGLLDHVIEVQEIRRKDAWILGQEADGTPIDLTGDEIVSMNLWGLSPSMIEGMRRGFHRFLEHWGANADREFFLSTAINGRIEVESSRVRVLHSRDPWFGLTHAGDRDWSRDMLLERIASGVYPQRLADGFAGRA